MVLKFLQKFLLLSIDDKKVITHIRADIGRKREFNRNEGFIRTETGQDKAAQGFVYEPSLDSRISKLRRTGPYFRIWFKALKNGDIYFVDFEKLNF
ncbi:MAG TPA: hypothetical protein PK247_06440 [Candidatus Goldiibacteriota bacterium]|nr:hypothetical protein [Candidatus Goldiibacteriota bacterium]HPN64823.1 hypothetical protein [Candidatus Goldiibacteriota bacterium]